MSNTTYYNPNSEFCLEVRQWFLDNPIDIKAEAESNGDVPPWNKGITGADSHLYGVPKSKEARIKMSNYAKTRTYSEETRKKISEGRMGIEPWNKGKKGLQVAWNKGIKTKKVNL